ncbi:MAG: hypothetical protein H6707_06805 [Deltaproteobacteria bacterium]|nr:hypothetical protein [Deltaproteobacteria bacterium]
MRCTTWLVVCCLLCSLSGVATAESSSDAHSLANSVSAQPATTADREADDDAKTAARLRVSGWLLVGAGAAAIAVSTVFGIFASKKESEFERGYYNNISYTEAVSINDRGERYEDMQRVALGIGIVCAVTGVVTYVMSYLWSNGSPATSDQSKSAHVDWARFGRITF